jgi:hypothetical protein
MTMRERSIRVARGEFADVDDALGWAVRMLDAELKGATMIRVEVVQSQVCGTGESEFVSEWTASVSGLIEEEDQDPWQH